MFAHYKHIEVWKTNNVNINTNCHKQVIPQTKEGRKEERGEGGKIRMSLALEFIEKYEINRKKKGKFIKSILEEEEDVCPQSERASTN